MVQVGVASHVLIKLTVYRSLACLSTGDPWCDVTTKSSVSRDGIVRLALDSVFVTLPVFTRRRNIHIWSVLHSALLAFLSSVKQLAVTGDEWDAVTRRR
jgi:hypothetical protein